MAGRRQMELTPKKLKRGAVPFPVLDCKEDEFKVKLVHYCKADIERMGYQVDHWSLIITDRLYLRMSISILEVLKEKVAGEVKVVVQAFLGELYNKMMSFEESEKWEPKPEQHMQDWKGKNRGHFE